MHRNEPTSNYSEELADFMESHEKIPIVEFKEIGIDNKTQFFGLTNETDGETIFSNSLDVALACTSLMLTLLLCYCFYLYCCKGKNSAIDEQVTVNQGNLEERNEMVEREEDYPRSATILARTSGVRFFNRQSNLNESERRKEIGSKESVVFYDKAGTNSFDSHVQLHQSLSSGK